MISAKRSDVGKARRPYRIKVRPIEIVGDAVKITLTQGRFAYVDLADRALVEPHNWCAHSGGRGCFYAARGNRRGAKAVVLLAREIVGATGADNVEHIDGDTLNCRQSNLRIIKRCAGGALPVPKPRNIRPVEIVGDSARIILTRGFFAWIDTADIPLVAGRNWCARVLAGGKLIYAVRRVGVKNFFLHRVLMSPPDGLHVDHADGDGLNNRRSNLRVATRQQNRWNTGLTTRNTSGVVGAYLDRRRGKFAARITVNGVRRQLGVFDTAEEAGAAYAAAAERLHGEFASTRRGSSSSSGVAA